MAKIDVVCPRYSETNGVIRNVHSGAGAQLYRCKHCLKTFQLSYRYNGDKPEAHQTLIGSGCRDTARVLKISLNTILRLCPHPQACPRPCLRSTQCPDFTATSGFIEPV